jgi:hypothetical protein
MKTTDGYEAIKGGYYFLENGQSVILEECATTDDGKTAFLVETMTVSGAGGEHHEIHGFYEHPADLTLAISIFKVAPIEKLDDRYQKKLSEIESLALSVGEIKKQLNKMSSEKFKIDRTIKDLYRDCEKAKESMLQSKEELSKASELVNLKRNELSNLEDLIRSLKDANPSQTVSMDELQRLRKRDFELQCLENGGVDNWEWYSESLEEFRRRYPKTNRILKTSITNR